MKSTMERLGFYFFLLLVTIASCKKDESVINNTQQPPQEPPIRWNTVFQTSYSAFFTDVAFAPTNRQLGLAVGLYDSLYPDPNLAAIRLMIWRTVDGGQTWHRPFTVGRPFDFDRRIAVQFMNDQTALVVGGHIALRSNNAGITWSSIPQIQSQDYLIDVSFFEASGYILGYDNNTSQYILYVTTNGGTTWNRRVVSNYHWTSLFAVDATTCWATIAGTGLYRTSNTGTTWDSVFPGAYRKVYFSDQNHGLALGATDFVRTSNGGSLWSRFTLTSFYVGDWVGSIRVDGRAVVAANGSHIYRSSDWGATWERERADSTNITIDGVCILNTQTRVAVATKYGVFPGSMVGYILRSMQ